MKCNKRTLELKRVLVSTGNKKNDTFIFLAYDRRQNCVKKEGFYFYFFTIPSTYGSVSVYGAY